MSQTMMRVVKNKENPYLMLNKTSINDRNLSWKSKGLHAYLLSLPDDWKIYIEELKKHANDGRESTANGIKELIENGYIDRKSVHDEKGRFKGYEYLVFEVPGTENGKPVNGKTEIGISENGKLEATNKELKPKNKRTEKSSSTPPPEKTIDDDEALNFCNEFKKQTGADLIPRAIKTLIKTYGINKLNKDLCTFTSKKIKLDNIAGSFVSYVLGEFILPVNQDIKVEQFNFKERQYSIEDFRNYEKNYDEPEVSQWLR